MSEDAKPMVLSAGADVSIVSDGTAEGTKVYNADGSEMTMVTAVEWKLDCNGSRLGTARITFIEVPVHVVGKLEGMDLPDS